MEDYKCGRPIVVIDDDPEDLDLIKELIRQLDLPYQVEAFLAPNSALSHLLSSPVSPFLIICDINMPKMDGFQLRSELLDAGGDIATAPFFFLSTSKSPGEIRLAQEYEATGFYQKAPSMEDMQEIVRTICLSVSQ